MDFDSKGTKGVLSQGTVGGGQKNLRELLVVPRARHAQHAQVTAKSWWPKSRRLDVMAM